VGEVAAKSEGNQVRAKVREKAAGNKPPLKVAKNVALTAMTPDHLYLQRFSFFRAALAPSLPRAVRVLFDKCAIVLFCRAALAAFLMFRFAAARCFSVVISSSEKPSGTKAYA
jgi:hypothetical protein